MKSIKKALIAFIIVVILLTIMINGMFNKAKEQIFNEQLQYEKHLNEDYILNGDTLQIIDYSIISGTYKLSDNTEINKNLID